MSTLSARDALVAHVCRVSEEDRPLAMEPAATCLYAVFAADDRTRFLGLVSAGEVAENPGRLFADLLPRRLPCVVADTEPLEEILRCMDRSDHWCFPVVDGQGCFIGAVTRASVLEVLLRTHGRLLEDNRRLTRRLLVLQERERRRMARELHDELGQYLAALRTELEHLRLLSGDDDRFLRQIGAIEEVLAHVHHAVRHLMNRLRPELLDQLGLPDTLRELVAEFQNRFPNVAFFPRSQW
ncbi:MAG TPA: CBS domain-containing protein [Methylothermaceae bacterium]|nr:CBS domain-containing protein [Methylothermaceae bacterium]